MSKKKVPVEVPTRVARHYLIAGLLTESSVDRVISVLVKRGYTVGALEDSGRPYMTRENNLVVCMHLVLDKKVPETLEDSRTFILNDVIDVFEVTNTKYLLVWMGDVGTSGMSWNLGNVTRDPVEEKVNMGPYRSSGSN